MAAHEIDKFGFPLSPKLRELEDNLCTIAGAWRASWENEVRQKELVEEYRRVVEKLYSLEWDGSIDIECELPDKLMPREYMRRCGKLFDE